MTWLKKLMMYFFFQLVSFTILAQEQESIFRTSGKIYVVVSVLVTIFLGILIYLISIDKKITRIERKNTVEKLEN